MKDDSRCTKNDYCGFQPVSEDDKHLKEACEFCGKSVVYKKVNGHVAHKAKYRRDHVRDFCQPYGATRHIFFRVYGKDGVVKNEKDRKRQEKQKKRWEGFWDDAKTWVKRGTETMFVKKQDG